MKLKEQDIYRILIKTGNAIHDPVIDEDAEEWTKKYDEQYATIMAREEEMKRQYQESLRTENFNQVRANFTNALSNLILNDTMAEVVASRILNRVLDGLVKGNGSALINRLVSKLSEEDD